MTTPLHVTSYYSFLRGVSAPHDLFSVAQAQGHRALALTDRHSVAGMVRAHDAACQSGVRLLPGCRLDLLDGSTLLAYPVDRAGWGALCRLLTLGHRRGARDVFSLDWGDLLQGARGLVLVLLPDQPDAQAQQQFQHLARIGAANSQPVYCGLSHRNAPGDLLRLRALEALAASCGVAAVVTGDVLYHEARCHVLQDVVTAIRENCTLDTLGERRENHGDRALKTPGAVAQLYEAFPEALARVAEIEAHCRFSMDDLCYQYPQETDRPDETPQQTLTRLVQEALPRRYPAGVTDAVRQQIAHELALIGSLGYAPYFLTVHSIVHQARALDIVCQGRGSAANSAICYVLGITAIDPVRSGLLFERFISAERREPPDIDVDFESDRREEIIQWIYRRYGRSHAALCATLMRYRPKGALRETGKVLGLSEDLLGLLSKYLASSLGDPEQLKARAAELNLNLSDRRLALTLRVAAELVGIPRQLGTHPGGFVLTRDRLDELVPIQPAAMEDRQIIVWDKDDIDILKFMKVDVLGLGMLGCLRRGFELLAEHRIRQLDMGSVPPEDDATYAMIRRADTLGTFQIESRAQMSMLPRLKPRTFYDLVIQVAIVRPGPIQGDMVHPYLRRREGIELPDYPQPELRQILGKTLGVPLFQEQAMQVAIKCAGFTPGEADQLRRSMATFKFTGGVSHFRTKLIEGMVANHYDRAFAERTFRQLEGFGSYGFPESHAASFALVAYVSNYLKCHHPDVFCAALLNSQPMGFYAPAQVVRDAREHGVTVHAIDINASRWDCVLEPDRGKRTLAVRLGLRFVKGLSNDHAAKLIAHRFPAYESLDDVWRRATIPVSALEALAAADVFRSLDLDRRAALWAIKGLADTVLPLFAAADRKLNRPGPEVIEPDYAPRPMSEGREVVEDYNTLGLTLRQHPLSFLRPQLAERGMVTCADLRRLRDGSRVVVPGLVLMRQRPGTAHGVMFMTLEDETGTANIIIWKDRAEAQRRIVIGVNAVACHGTLQREGEVIHVVMQRLEDITNMMRSIAVSEEEEGAVAPRLKARDFH
ncbi:error-prone DNA polymerase [Asaia bogorensis]|uniref:error-prone DNA polymerase n=1 Tax=Asaia bogorensis TaxID=91915 RepID=UPI0028572E4F|nr:error-prone DNA polymerase [Asaia bogorensis]MDR6181166.1 error-prone DNA polymerase [Asaia bogorensis NBRC 16594]